MCGFSFFFLVYSPIHACVHVHVNVCIFLVFFPFQILWHINDYISSLDKLSSVLASLIISGLKCLKANPYLCTL